MFHLLSPLFLFFLSLFSIYSLFIHLSLSLFFPSPHLHPSKSKQRYQRSDSLSVSFEINPTQLFLAPPHSASDATTFEYPAKTDVAPSSDNSPITLPEYLDEQALQIDVFNYKTHILFGSAFFPLRDLATAAASGEAAEKTLDLSAPIWAPFPLSTREQPQAVPSTFYPQLFLFHNRTAPFSSRPSTPTTPHAVDGSASVDLAALPPLSLCLGRLSITLTHQAAPPSLPPPILLSSKIPRHIRIAPAGPGVLMEPEGKFVSFARLRSQRRPPSPLMEIGVSGGGGGGRGGGGVKGTGSSQKVAVMKQRQSVC